MTYLISLIIAAFLGIIPGKIAQKKGHSFWLWWFYGWMLFIVAIIHVQFIADLNAPDQLTGYNGTTGPAGYNGASGTGYGTTGYTGTAGAPGTPGNVWTGDASRSIGAAGTPGNYSVADEIMKYKSLLDDGIITQEEFETKKRQLLGL